MPKTKQPPKNDLAVVSSPEATEQGKQGRTWTLEEKAENVHLIRFTFNAGWEQYVLLASDIHYDNPHCDRALFKKHLEQARERDAPIIIPGDLFCVMQGKFDPRRSLSNVRPEHKTDDYLQAVVETTARDLAPYSDLIALIGYGNHETAITKNNGVDIIRWLCRELGVYRGGYRGFVRFLFEHEGKRSRQSRTMFYSHGAGGGGPVTRGVIKSNRRAAMVRNVDIVLAGHIHESWVLENPQLSLNEQHAVKHRTQFHIQCPTYKDEIGSGAHGWANEKEFPPKPLGGWWLKFSATSKHIRVSVERAD